MRAKQEVKGWRRYGKRNDGKKRSIMSPPMVQGRSSQLENNC